MRNKFLASLAHKQAGAFPYLLSFFIALFLLVTSNAYAQETAQRARAGEDTNAAGSTSGSITGRVTGEDGRPVGDIQIFIYSAYSSMSPRASVTDTGGRFSFKELSPGLYTLRPSTPAYVSLPDENLFNPWEPKYFRPGDAAQLTIVRGGVITGTVLNAQSEPLVGAMVRALRVRDSQGRRIPMDSAFGGMPRMTDDRGVYRIYGLHPGSYVLMVGGGNPYSYGRPNLYESDTPTYYPSSTRDTAVEVFVRVGEEATGVDIRYRGERGRAVSGTVTGAANTTGRFGIGVTLTRAVTGTFENQTFVADVGGKRAFSLNGVPEGEYEIAAQGYFEKGETVASTPRRITVRGADITGLQLQLAPLASITGRITLEPVKDEACSKTNVATSMQQTLVTARREDENKERLQAERFSESGNIPNEQGEFLIRNLAGGLFRLGVRAPGEDWYVRALSLPASTARTATDPSKSTEAKILLPPTGTLAIKTGERLSGININLAQGAANLRGRVVMQPEGAAIPANLRAYLIPTERERANDILRYAESNLSADGSFVFTSLAPGRYWIALRPAPTQADTLQAPRMLAWDEEERKVLRREAEAVNKVVELKPCQRMTDYTLGYTAK
ncbi:MAG TPA: carboxypeptidase-like regulatory domain-containing protein [Pyrinomonadaceae bacterium]|jgi:protocatechuate 3,4-dioxygenase beta subunit